MKRNLARFCMALALIICLTGVSVLADNEGTQSDPLVTLSYLTQTVKPDILSQVDAKIATATTALTEKWNAAIAAYPAQTGSGGASYVLVTLSSGQSLKMDVGCEVMLRLGTAACVATSSPGLIDSTGGGTLNNGGSLVQNHLYMATMEGRSISAGSATVKLMVRGSYTIT